MTNSTTYISRSPREQDGQNLSLLQEQALAAIQAYAPETWTDHNSTDPGITLLEILAFVISDLSYRLGFPIRDLMSWPDEQQIKKATPFWLAPDILPSNAVTLADYQRLILDVAGVRSASLKQNDQGRYSVTIDTDDSYDISTDTKRLALAAKIRQRFLQERNVNDDIAELNFIEKHPVTLKLAFAFSPIEDPVDTLVDIFRRLSDAISLGVNRQSLQALMDQGLTPDEIMQGPLVHQGFIANDELDNAAFPDTLFTSDLIAALADITPLEEIKTLTFVPSVESSEDENTQDNGVHWLYVLDETESGKSFSLDLVSTLTTLEIEIDGQVYPLNQAQINDILDGLTTAVISDEAVTASELKDLTLYQQGKYRELSAYVSLQHEFPSVYKLVDERLNGNIDTEEMAKIMQFKGFLSLFDQILADQFAQLEVLKTLLALPTQGQFESLACIFDKMLASEPLKEQELSVFWQAVTHLPNTYVSQPVSDISGMENLLGDYWHNYTQSGFQPIAEGAFSLPLLERLNRGMAHLLARYAQTSLDANLLQYEDVLSFYLTRLKNSAEQHGLAVPTLTDKAFLKRMIQLKQVVDKASLLLDYPRLSRYRSGGFNYLKANPKENHMTALGHRVLRFLGVNKTNVLPLSINNKEGMYVLEGTLLWAANLLDSDVSEMDVKRSVFFVLPDWPTRFRNSHFQTLLEGAIARETPVHCTAEVLYLDRQTMNYFEQLYYAWLNAMMKCPFTVKNGEQEISVDDLYSTQWLAALSNTLRCFLVSPADTDITPDSYLAPIGGAVINPTSPETEQNNFRVHYQPLDFLKSKSVIGTAVIKPNDALNTFNIQIQSPNIIKE